MEQARGVVPKSRAVFGKRTRSTTTTTTMTATVLRQSRIDPLEGNVGRTADADSPSTAMHITTNRLHSAAFAAIAAIAAAANFVSVLQSNDAEFQRAAAAFFTADFSPSLSLRRLRCVRRTMAAHFADCSLRFAVSVPSLLVYQSACSVRGPSQMKSVDQMAADGCGAPLCGSCSALHWRCKWPNLQR